MYESPITKIIGEIQQQTIQDDENNLLYQVRQSIGYSVDKEELLKALNYDREQYQKGYRDGLNADKWIPVSERLPEPYGQVLRTVKSIGWNGTFSIYVDIGTVCPIDTNVIAWMPLPVPMIPEPYREESEGKG